MNSSFSSVDISKIPELVRMTEKVKEKKTPLILTKDKEAVGVLMPADTNLLAVSKKSKASLEDLMSAAGSWKDIDTDALLKKIYKDRAANNRRPPVKL